MKYLLPLFFALSICLPLSARQATLDSLIASQKGHSHQISKIKAYWKEGVQKKMPVGNVKPEDFIAVVKKFIGTRYRFGSTSPKTGFDCSGLMSTTFKTLGIPAPHNSHELGRYGKILIDRKQLKVGDLVFFTKTYNTGLLVTHSGFYIGDGKMVHASAQKGVIITEISDPYYWNKHYLFATRIFDDGTTAEEPVLAVNDQPAPPVAEKKEEVKEEVPVQPKPAAPVTPAPPAVAPLKVGDKQVGTGRLQQKAQNNSQWLQIQSQQAYCDHATLPFGTLVKVTNLKTKNAEIVEINDRPGKQSGAMLLLSKKAMKKLQQPNGVSLEVIKLK